MNVTKLHLIERKDGLLFAPWGFFMTLGACWVVSVPPNADHASLHRLVRWFNIATIAAFLLAIAVAKLVGLPFAGFFGGVWLTVLMLYSLCALHRISGWQRISFAQAVQDVVPVGEAGNVSLASQVLLGLIATSFVVAFRLYEIFAVAYCVFLLINSAMAGMAAFRRTRASA